MKQQAHPIRHGYNASEHVNAVTKMINNHKQLQQQCSMKSDAEAGTQQASLTNWWRRWINYQGFILARWIRTLQPAMPDVYRAVITSFIIPSRHATLSRNCQSCHLNTIHHHCLRASDPNARKSLDLYLVSCRGEG